VDNGEYAVQVKNFSKAFGKVLVIKDLSFDVKKGEILAFLGANGSGKTTTLRCLLNIYAEDSGSLLVFGEEYTYKLAGRVVIA
jgi:ABC-2 type transport system ATP-binding protein